MTAEKDETIEQTEFAMTTERRQRGDRETTTDDEEQTTLRSWSLQ